MTEKIIRQKITFYLYDYTGKLARRPKKIYSPYNVKTLGRIPKEDRYNRPDYIEFYEWTYILDPENLSNDRYDEQFEWINFYNMRWWKLSKWKRDARFLNWRKYRNDWIHIIRMEKPIEETKTKTKTITEVVNKQQIPLVVLETMNLPQIKQLAEQWKIELPVGIMEKGDAKQISEIIIELMRSNWNIQESE